MGKSRSSITAANGVSIPNPGLKFDWKESMSQVVNKFVVHKHKSKVVGVER